MVLHLFFRPVFSVQIIPRKHFNMKLEGNHKSLVPVKSFPTEYKSDIQIIRSRRHYVHERNDNFSKRDIKYNLKGGK